MADTLTEVMHLYSMDGLTCYWRIHGNEWCIVKYLSGTLEFGLVVNKQFVDNRHDRDKVKKV